MISKYMTIVTTIEELDREVNKLIKEGWQPLGSPILMNEISMMQAMVKKDSMYLCE